MLFPCIHPSVWICSLCVFRLRPVLTHSHASTGAVLMLVCLGAAFFNYIFYFFVLDHGMELSELSNFFFPPMYKTIWSSLAKEFFVFEVCFIMRRDHPKPVSSWDTIGLFSLWFSSFSVLESDNKSFLNLCFFWGGQGCELCVWLSDFHNYYFFLCFVFMCV